MLGPRSPRPPSRRRRGTVRTLLVTGTIVVGLLVLSLGVPSVSYTNAELTRSGNIPLVSETNEANAVHGLDKHPAAKETTTDPLVNVTNNFGTGSTNLGYRVKLLNNTKNANLSVGGTDEGNISNFSLKSGNTKKVNITTSSIAPATIKYSVNVTNRTLAANATRTIDVTA